MYILPDHPRPQRSAIRATPQSFEPNQLDTVELSLRQSGHASRIDQSRRWQTPVFYSSPQHTVDSTTMEKGGREKINVVSINN